MRYEIFDSNDVLVNTIVCESDSDVTEFVPAGGRFVNLDTGDDSRVIMRRAQRIDQFARTIDLMNEAWWQSLTDNQRLRFKAFRLMWLDYPTSTAAYPPPFFDVDATNTNVSTYVEDIFGEGTYDPATMDYANTDFRE